MQRNIIIAMVVAILLLGAALAFVLLRGQGAAPAPVTINAADENAVEPLHQEMDCIDRLMQNNDLNANEVGPGLARCHAEASGNQSAGH